MKTLFSMQEYELAKSTHKLPLECEWCGKTFYQVKKLITQCLNKPGYEMRNRFCSLTCAHAAMNETFEEPCVNCAKAIFRQPSEKRKSRSGKSFCSRNCAAIYNNTHKTTGNRRSKLEIWIEEQLTKLYPNLVIRYNQKEAINSELDIYIPSLNLAFELNGIYHYEPIHGQDKLASIQNNDNRKFQACLEKGIEMVIVDTSSLKYFKPHNADKYLIIICRIINQKNK